MSEDTTMLEDKQGFCDPGLLVGALLRLAPLQGLDLDLPVDAGKAAALLQNSLYFTPFLVSHSNVECLSHTGRDAAHVECVLLLAVMLHMSSV